MNNFKKIEFKLTTLKFYKETSGDENFVEIFYGEHSGLREKVIDFITCITSDFSHIFTSCTQCGNCCKRPDISVRGGELFQIAKHLGVEEKVFYSEYLNPSESWSDYDGFMKLSEGKCPFLEEKLSGKYICKIYNCRPQNCIAFSSPSLLCRREIPDLIEHIKSIEIENEKVTLFSNSKKTIEGTLSEKAKERFSSVLSHISQIEPARANNTAIVFSKVKEIMKHLEEGKISYEDFRGNFYRLKIIVKHIWEKKAFYSGEIEELWNTVCNMEMKFMEADEGAGKDRQENLLTINGLSLKKITFYPGKLDMVYIENDKEHDYSLSYSSDKSILKSIKSLVSNITLHIKKNSPLILGKIEGDCYICGKCCEPYIIDLHPSEISRFAEEFKMTEEEFRKEYTLPGRFTWNPGSGVLKKIEYETGRRRCIFLKKGDLDSYYCYVHSIKPEMCRLYKPGKGHCYGSMEDEFHYRLIDNIQTIQLKPGYLEVATIYTGIKFEEPLYINWHSNSLLKEDVERIISALTNYLSKNQPLLDRKNENLFEMRFYWIPYFFSLIKAICAYHLFQKK